MRGPTHTKHSRVRSQQRCLNRFVIDILFNYGESRRCRGGVDGLFFSRDSLRQIMNDLGSRIFKMCEKYKNAYLIVAEDGVLITAARSNRRTIH